MSALRSSIVILGGKAVDALLQPPDVTVLVAMIAPRGVTLLNDDLSQLYQERLLPVSQLARINELMHSINLLRAWNGAASGP